MKKALRQNPKMLRTMLTKQRENLVSERTKAAERGDGEALSKISAAITQVDDALQKLDEEAHNEVLAAEEEEDTTPQVMGEDPDVQEEEGFAEGPEEEDDAASAPPGLGLGFGTPGGDDDDEEEDEEDNPVRMTSTLRRQMGDHAANFLDDYALTVYQKVMQFLDKLQNVALELGDEDDEDGVTSLREALRDAVGRMGVEAVEPVFEEWRAAVFRTLAKDMKKMFEPSEPVRELQDQEVGRLLGLDHLGLDDESMADEEEPEDEDEDLEDEGEEDEGEEEEVEAAAAFDAPLAIATGPVSMTVTGKKSVSAAVADRKTTKARDFRPSGLGSPQLE